MFEKLHFVSSLKTSKLWRNDIISSGDHHGFMRIFSSARYCGISKFSFMGQIAFTLCCFLSLEVAEMIWILGQDLVYSEKGLFLVVFYHHRWLLHGGFNLCQAMTCRKEKKDRGHTCKAASTGILRGQKASKLRRLHAVSFSLITVAFSEAILCLSRKESADFSSKFALSLFKYK